MKMVVTKRNGKKKRGSRKGSEEDAPIFRPLYEFWAAVVSPGFLPNDSFGRTLGGQAVYPRL